MNKLWTKNFTIITLGTVISMLGNAVSGFALGVLVLDLTQSTFAFAIYMVIYNLPRLIVPMVAGTFLDRFSRIKVIYSLDFISSILYAFVFIGLLNDFFNYPILLILASVIGIIDSVYQVAYDSLYPTLISKGNFSKAYSISSMIYPLAALMTPIAAFIYETIGLEILFLFNSISFFIAAIFETQIKAKEKHLENRVKHQKINVFKEDYKQGIKYLFSEKGLLTITAFFFMSSLFQNSFTHTLELPFFKSSVGLGVVYYTVVSSANVFGRFVGGLLHYRFVFPNNVKFKIAMFVYTIICFLIGTYLFMPFPLMVAFNFLVGLFAVTSFNIRISSTQAYVPNELRGRFNGIFQTFTTFGMVVGQLIAGALGEVFDIRYIILFTNVITLIFTYLIVFRNRHHVSPIYNRTV